MNTSLFVSDLARPLSLVAPLLDSSPEGRAKTKEMKFSVTLWLRGRYR